MKAILVVDIDDSYFPIKKESITLERGIITYRDLNNIPYRIEINNFCFKPLPQKKGVSLKEAIGIACFCYSDGWNDCLNEIEGEKNEF